MSRTSSSGAVPLHSRTTCSAGGADPPAPPAGRTRPAHDHTRPGVLFMIIRRALGVESSTRGVAALDSPGARVPAPNVPVDADRAATAAGSVDSSGPDTRDVNLPQASAAPYPLPRVRGPRHPRAGAG